MHERVTNINTSSHLAKFGILNSSKIDKESKSYRRIFSNNEHFKKIKSKTKIEQTQRNSVGNRVTQTGVKSNIPSDLQKAPEQKELRTMTGTLRARR